jgi:hypothetical protein
MCVGNTCGFCLLASWIERDINLEVAETTDEPFFFFLKKKKIRKCIVEEFFYAPVSFNEWFHIYLSNCMNLGTL